MANLGAHRALEALGVERLVTDVGDRYVLEAMRGSGASLGGEQSGHVIALDRQTTGDGLSTATMLLAALARADEPLEEAASLVQRTRSGWSTCAPTAAPGGRDAVWEAVEREDAALARPATAAIVLRASGTEPLVRVMVEHERTDASSACVLRLQRSSEAGARRCR